MIRCDPDVNLLLPAPSTPSCGQGEVYPRRALSATCACRQTQVAAHLRQGFHLRPSASAKAAADRSGYGGHDGKAGNSTNPNPKHSAVLLPHPTTRPNLRQPTQILLPGNERTPFILPIRNLRPGVAESALPVHSRPKPGSRPLLPRGDGPFTRGAITAYL